MLILIFSPVQIIMTHPLENLNIQVQKRTQVHETESRNSEDQEFRNHEMQGSPV